MMSDLAFLIVLLFAATGLGLAMVRILVGSTTQVAAAARRRHQFAPLGLRRIRKKVRTLAQNSTGSAQDPALPLLMRRSSAVALPVRSSKRSPRMIATIRNL